MIRPNRSNLGLNEKGKYASVKKRGGGKKGKSQSSKSSTLVEIGTYSQLLFTINFSVKSNISAVYHLHSHQLSFYQLLFYQ
jgi:hypothetical protein